MLLKCIYGDEMDDYVFTPFYIKKKSYSTIVKKIVIGLQDRKSLLRRLSLNVLI